MSHPLLCSLIWSLVLALMFVGEVTSKATGDDTPAGTLFVADLNGDPYAQSDVGRVLAFNASSGQYLRTVVTGLTVPSSVTIGPGGLLYVTDSGTGEVLTFNPSATNAPASSGTVFASGIYAPGGMLYDRQNNSMFVSELAETESGFVGENVYHYNASGQLIVTDGTGGVIGIGTGQTGRAGMALDSNQNLYVGTFDNSGSVLKFTSSSNYTSSSVFATGAYGASQMVFRNSNLLVDAQFEGAVLQYDSTGISTMNNPFIYLGSQAFDSGLIAHGTNGLLVSSIGSGSGPGQIGLYNIDTGAPLSSGSDSFITISNVDAGIPDNVYFQPTAAYVYYKPGDFNLDDHVGAADVPIMEQALTDLTAYQTLHDLSDDELLEIADINGDGKINNADLQALLDLLNSGGGSTNPVPEPSAGLLASLALTAVFYIYRRRSPQ